MPTVPRVEKRWSLLGSHPTSAAIYSVSPFVICAVIFLVLPGRRLQAGALLGTTTLILLLTVAMMRRWERHLTTSCGDGTHALAQFDLRHALPITEDGGVAKAIRRGKGYVPAIVSLTSAGVNVTPTPANARLGVPAAAIPWSSIQAITLSPMLLGFGGWGLVLHLDDGGRLHGDVLRGQAFADAVHRVLGSQE
jgi:hypothetical protein